MKYAEFENSTKIILKVTFVVLVLAFLWVIRDIILIFLLALILASAMDPMVEYFNIRRIPRAVSVLAVYALVLGFIAFALWLIIPSVIYQFQIIQNNLPAYTHALQEKLGPGLASELGIAEVFRGVVESVGGGAGFISGTFGVFNGLLSLITVLVISFYLVAEERGMKKFIASLVPDHHQDSVIHLVGKIQRKMGLWVIGQVILSFAIFSFTLIGLLILRVPNALILALLAGALEIIPYIGPFVSAIPAVIVAFIISPTLGLAVVILYIIIQKTEGYVLVPKIMEKTVGTSPLVVLLALLIGLKLGGVMGLLISVPLAGAVNVVIYEFWGRKNLPSEVV